VASRQFEIGTTQGTNLLRFYFMVVILSSNTSSNDIVISSITQSGEEVPELIKNLLCTTLQRFNDEKMLCSAEKEELVECLKPISPKQKEDVTSQITIFCFLTTHLEATTLCLEEYGFDDSCYSTSGEV